jgi:hypothetical protein
MSSEARAQRACKPETHLELDEGVNQRLLNPGRGAGGSSRCRILEDCCRAVDARSMLVGKGCWQAGGRELAGARWHRLEVDEGGGAGSECCGSGGLRRVEGGVEHLEVFERVVEHLNGRGGVKLGAKAAESRILNIAKRQEVLLLLL